MTKKEFNLIIFLLIGFVVLFIIINKSFNISNSETELSNTNVLNLGPVASLPKQNIFLYPVQEAENGMYKNFVLKIEDKEKLFYWENISNETYAPRLTLVDLNKDKKRELVLILTTATGTAVDIERVHVIDINTLKEIKVESPIDIIQNNVKTKLSTKEVEIVVDGHTIILDDKYMQIEPQNLFKDVFFGNIINFMIKDDKLNAVIPAQISPTSFIGEVKIIYTFQGNMYVMNSIEFIANN